MLVKEGPGHKILVNQSLHIDATNSMSDQEKAECISNEIIKTDDFKIHMVQNGNIIHFMCVLYVYNRSCVAKKSNLTSHK